MSAFHVAALVITAAGVATFAFGMLGADRRAAIGLALEMWTAAGLLNLSGDPSVRTIAAAAAIILVRRLVIRAMAVAQ